MGIYKSIVDSLYDNRLHLVEIGKDLIQARDERVWEHEIGSGIDTWYEFIALPEIGLSVVEANTLIEMAKLSDRYGADAIARIPIGTIRHMLKHGGDISDAQSLSTKDFKKKCFEVSGKDKSKNRVAEVSRLMVMKVFEDGTMEKVHNLDTDEILKALGDKIDTNNE